MTKIPFCKMSGSGNDFIIIDNRSGAWNHLREPAFVRSVCMRKMSVGADGCIFIEQSKACDFSWRFFNSDGSEAEMCGNGGRCAARFAALHGIAGSSLSFETIAGVISADVCGSMVKIQLPEPQGLETGVTVNVEGRPLVLHSVNTGVPHAVVFVDNLESVPVAETGSRIRFHERFHPAGTNVNFVSHDTGNMLHIRTYERGVEGETFACGTGSVAAAVISIALGKVSSPVQVTTRSGEALSVHASGPGPPFKHVFLEGGARFVCEGVIMEEGFSFR